MRTLTLQNTTFGSTQALSRLRELGRIALSIALMVGAMGIALSLLNRVPPLIQAAGQQSYVSVDQAETALGIRIPLPAYFPEFLGWPPAQITATRDDALVVTLVFPLRRSGETALIVMQILRDPETALPDLSALEPVRPLREKPVRIGDFTGVLRTGTDHDGRPWSRLTWRAKDRDMILIANFPEKTLLTMAGSIH